MRGYAADRYAKSKDTGYKKVIRDNNLQLHSRSAVMETYGAFSKDLWSLVTVLTDEQRLPCALTNAPKPGDKTTMRYGLPASWWPGPATS